MGEMRIHRLFSVPAGTILYRMKGANMKSQDQVSVSELYALELAARAARAREVSRLFHSGAGAVSRFVGRALSALDEREEIRHA